MTNLEAYNLDQGLLEEDIALNALREIVGSSMTSEEVDAELYRWRTYEEF